MHFTRASGGNVQIDRIIFEINNNRMTKKRFFRNTLGALITTLSLGIITETTASADEGMWLPSLISERIVDMQSKGFKLSAEDIYSVNQASLKDAVVLFGRGCTGEVISPEGLLLTNHHCGYSQIQQHSSVEHDYLRDGFWAMNRNEELPNKGLTVSSWKGWTMSLHGFSRDTPLLSRNPRETLS